MAVDPLSGERRVRPVRVQETTSHEKSLQLLEAVAPIDHRVIVRGRDLSHADSVRRLNIFSSIRFHEQKRTSDMWRET